MFWSVFEKWSEDGQVVLRRYVPLGAHLPVEVKRDSFGEGWRPCRQVVEHLPNSHRLSALAAWPGVFEAYEFLG